MYGLITRLTAAPGRRDELALGLLDPGIRRPGCHSYVVAFEPADDAAVWVTEVWISEEAHRAANAEPDTRALLRMSLPLIAVFGDTQITTPMGGIGL